MKKKQTERSTKPRRAREPSAQRRASPSPTQLNFARGVRETLSSGDERLINELCAELAQIDRVEPSLEKACREVFGDVLRPDDDDYELDEDELGDALYSLHSLHSLTCCEAIAELVERDELSLSVSAAWVISYLCGLWDEWEREGRALPISTLEAQAGGLDRAPLTQRLKGRHVRLTSPLCSATLELLQRLVSLGVASVKLDSLCDEQLGALIKSGDEVLTALEAGAERAMSAEQIEHVTRDDEVYVSWVNKALSKRGLTATQKARWRGVCLNASLAKTVTVGDHHLKMVFCPITAEAKRGLWVTRSVMSYGQEGSAWLESPKEIQALFNELATLKRYPQPYREDNEFELLASCRDYARRTFRLPTVEELVLLGGAGRGAKYAGSRFAFELKSTPTELEEELMVHPASAWGLYDIGVKVELAWHEGEDAAVGDDFFFDDCAHLFGKHSAELEVRNTGLPDSWRNSSYAFRLVLPT